jgi:site-specific recombinase XerD
MPRKLPDPLTKEEFDKLFKEVKNFREEYHKTYYGKKTQKYSPRGGRVNQYMIAMILQFYSGMRLSEVLGLKPEVSLCCHVEFNLRKERNKTIKICSECKTEFSVSKYTRGRLLDNWDIEPLTPERVKEDRILVSQGKGQKDRWIPRPKMINQSAVNKLPLTCSRRAYSDFLRKMGLKVLGRKVNTHLLRHSFATHFLKKNPGDLKTLQILLGHSRLDTTGIYAHVAIDDALKKVEDSF